MYIHDTVGENETHPVHGELERTNVIRTQHRAAYVKALQEVDETIEDTLDISPLANLMERIIIEAIRTQIRPG